MGTFYRLSCEKIFLVEAEGSGLHHPCCMLKCSVVSTRPEAGLLLKNWQDVLLKYLLGLGPPCMLH